MGLARGLLKLGILGGTVYITTAQGIWSDSKTTVEVLQKVSHVPITEHYVEQFSWTNEVNSKAAHYWNTGVQYSFSALAQLPTNISNGVTTGITMAKNAVQKSLNPESSK